MSDAQTPPEDVDDELDEEGKPIKDKTNQGKSAEAHANAPGQQKKSQPVVDHRD